MALVLHRATNQPLNLERRFAKLGHVTNALLSALDRVIRHSLELGDEAYPTTQCCPHYANRLHDEAEGRNRPAFNAVLPPSLCRCDEPSTPSVSFPTSPRTHETLVFGKALSYSLVTVTNPMPHGVNCHCRCTRLRASPLLLLLFDWFLLSS